MTVTIVKYFMTINVSTGVAHTFNTVIWEVEAGGPEVQYHLSSSWLCLTKENNHFAISIC